MLSKQTITRLITEEVENFKKVHETIERSDYPVLRDIIRMEVASILYDLFKKRSIWI